MIEIILLLACCCFIFIVVLAGYFLNLPKEDDECEGKDENGTYIIAKVGTNDKLECTLDKCATGYYKSGKECLVDNSGVVCVPTGTPDPQGAYLTTKIGGCELSSCETDFVIEGDGCVVGSYVNADTVRFTRTNGPLMIAEVMIYGENNKLLSHETTGVTVTSSATHPNWGGVGRLTDKDWSAPFHSLNSDTDTFIEFKFSAVKRIESIRVVPRIDARGNEIGDVSIEVLNGTTSVVEAPIPTWTSTSSYVIKFDPKTGTFKSTSVDLAAVKTLITTLN
jgi:hypothetical protein